MHDVEVVRFLANLLVILISAKCFGEIAERFGQPPVLGELLGGVFLGLGLVHFFQPQDPALSLMAEFGVILLLFETGLESRLSQILKVGRPALAVAVVGIVLPFAMGMGLLHLLDFAIRPSLFLSAALTATSIGITARILSDAGQLQRLEAQIILGAAVIDDILGVVILSMVQNAAGDGPFSWGNTGKTLLLAAAFVGLALWIGPSVSRVIVRGVERMKGRGVWTTLPICFAFAMALVAHHLGTALIVGAFAAGILFSETNRHEEISRSLKPVSDVFVPVFFVMIGARINLTHYAPWAAENWPTLKLAGLLIVVAILSKALCGWAAKARQVDPWAIGVGMIPRGEVGLIFAQVGLAAQALSEAHYAALVGMVVVTTFLTPPLLKRFF